MRAPISVILPTLNAADHLPACLNSLGEGLAEGLIRELILSDGGSTDATLQIAQSAGAEVVTGPASRGGQLRRGAEAAQGEWLLILHADSVLAPGWAEAVLRALPTPGAYHFRLRFDAGGVASLMVAAWANARARRFHLPYGDQGLLIDRATYEAAGGYADMPLMEDVALARALGARLQELPAEIVTSAEKYQRQGWLRRGGRNLLTLARYLMGADPAKLAQAYRKA
ncbi:TIGR04283 family arsenosugar biosynthesis glycosyltransferase [Tropicibacter naphthalenivorans]|uniref:PGL/p-HBAD biosynthesis glycosyltransferase/MT3031 n=1 Tax=Tropicibacter naphthalenivorans TaxID=441103 RepID=A0A0P1GZ61_9RHOB|nr:TIGR04283 family arsenosugar biosynthesis glycosyltransferase [Tropicibacter naphthalenivorans]CUH81484.1 PGL/p-HBAD biosynthesis glycosyltransferase/MT3031 [Tropicibacter naphthalenivorans]SMD00188.1 Glycosyl transferase family 2 [Tropicibacter naphthalenivorans]